MIRGKTVLAVVPARGGSKGVPLKNIHPVKGVPLIALTGRVTSQLTEIDRCVVSTDHPEIARIAKASGIDAPFMRPPDLSGDRIADWDVLVHALRECEKIDGRRYDIVLMLQPTSPLRTAGQLRSVLQKMTDEDLDSVWTVSETNLKFHPLKQLTLTEGRLNYFDHRGREIVARQQLDKVYHRNGVAYAITRDCLLEQKTILGAKAGAVVIAETVVNIDTMEDFDHLERLLSSH